MPEHVDSDLSEERPHASAWDQLLDFKASLLGEVTQSMFRITVEVVRDLMAGPIHRRCQQDSSLRAQHSMEFLPHRERIGNVFEHFGTEDRIEALRGDGDG